jgi:dsRNA-specific ribonuclease
VKVQGYDVMTGEGGSKRQAEQDAAARLLAIVAPESTA